MKRRRTITIANMITNWYVRRWQWGVPHGFYVHWAGRAHALDPVEFISWPEVSRAIDARLRMARLRRVGEVMRLGLGYWERIKVTVERIS
jgi:hypothetical protein